MDKIREVAVVVGSLRKGSLNRQLANSLAELAPATLKLNIIDIGHLPIYNQDGDEEPPASWNEFRDRIKAADAVLFVTPEHNRSVPRRVEERLGRRLKALWKERVERQARRGRQRIARRYRRIWRKSSSAAIAGVSERARDGPAGGLYRWRRQTFRRDRQACQRWDA